MKGLKQAAGLTLFLCLCFGLLVLAFWLEQQDPPDKDPNIPTDTPPLAVGLRFSPVAFEALPGFAEDSVSDALPALHKSCARLATLPEGRSLGGQTMARTAGAWRVACAALLDLDPVASDAAVRRVLTTHFQPFAVSLGADDMGLFTGYYEPLLKGSLTQSARYSVPLHAKPADLVQVDLGIFRRDLKGRRIAGRLRDGRLVPYADRAAIGRGALDGSVETVMWVDDPVDAFFLHIQGSGRVLLDTGERVRLAYAAQNGHPYRALGAVLIEEGYMTRDAVSMPSIRQWLANHPDDARALMNRNKSYIFFSLEGDVSEGPLGSAGVPLTPGRSLAVDRTKLPLHAPIWLVSDYPDPDNPDGPPLPLARLMVAQDTGGAIRGHIRGDVFWGEGDAAATIAGHMKSKGRYFILLPKAVPAVTPDARAR